MALDSAKLTQTTQQALDGSGRLLLTFGRGNITELSYLLGMDGNILDIDLGDKSVLLAVTSSLCWEGDENRQYKVTLKKDDFDMEWFVGLMRKALDNATVI